MSRCPFCRDAIAEKADGVECAKCGTPHHGSCWTEHGGRCTIAGCGSPTSRPLRALATARRAIAIGREVVAGAYENARERFGGKTTVALFLVSGLVAGLGVAPLLYTAHASKKVDVEVVLGALFAVLAAWITVLLYRGAELEDDYDVRIGQSSPGDFPVNLTAGDIDAGSGGCAEAILGVVISVILAVVISVLFPVVAWLAVDIVFPLLALAIYGTLYHALAFAVNGRESLEGRLGASLLRGIGFAALYTGGIGGLIAAAVAAFHANR